MTDFHKKIRRKIRMRAILFRGQTRKRGEKVRMSGGKLPGNWRYGGIFSGTGDYCGFEQEV